MSRSKSRRVPPALVTVVASVPILAFVLMALSASNWDPTVFVGFGADATATTEYAEEKLGEVALRLTQGHDGKYFFVQANDPLVRDPANNAAIIDHPVYRSQRMLYPLLAGGFGLLAPAGIVWGMLVLNVLGMSAGTYGTALLARRLGGSPWWGAAFPANIGLLYALTSDVSDIWAAAFAIWAVYFLYEHRMAAAVTGLTFAALSREVMIICALGAGIWLWTEGRRRSALIAIIAPAVVLGTWIAYLRMQLGPDEISPRALGVPFVGLAEAVPAWWDRPISAAAGIGTIAILTLFTSRWVTTRTALGWSFIGFVPLALVMTAKVWNEVFDFTRALAPMMTAAVLLIFVESRSMSDARFSAVDSQMSV